MDFSKMKPSGADDRPGLRESIPDTYLRELEPTDKGLFIATTDNEYFELSAVAIDGLLAAYTGTMPFTRFQHREGPLPFGNIRYSEESSEHKVHSIVGIEVLDEHAVFATREKAFKFSRNNFLKLMEAISNSDYKLRIPKGPCQNCEDTV